jgi:hypothetical protein
MRIWTSGSVASTPFRLRRGPSGRPVTAVPRISDEAGQRKRAARVDDDLGGPDVQCACQDRAL